MHNIHCVNCGWTEASHHETTGLGYEEENDSSGFRYSLRQCPGYTADPAGLEEFQKQEKERNPYIYKQKAVG